MKPKTMDTIFAQAFEHKPVAGYTDGFRDLTPSQREAYHKAKPWEQAESHVLSVRGFKTIH